MRNELRTEDIEVFSAAIAHFFDTYTGETANVRSAYLLEANQSVLWNDFNGLIEISGDYAGSVCFSAPRAMLSHVLLKMGETIFTDDRHSDIVGEIANTLSGQARRHFGDRLHISPPRLADPSLVDVEFSPDRRPYAIPLLWHGYEANLVVRLAPKGRA